MPQESVFDGGTSGPVKAPGEMTLAEMAALEEQRRARRREQEKYELAARNEAYRRTRGASDEHGRLLNNDTVARERIARTGSAQGNRGGFLENLSKDPVTAGVLLAPYGVVGAGAAFGGLGAGSAIGGAPLAGSAGAPAGLPATTSLGTIASPFGPGTLAKGAGGAAAAAGGSGAAAGGAAAGGGWTAKDTARTFLPLGASLAFEGVKGLFGGDSSKEQKALIAKQEQMAREAEMRRYQMQTARMDAMGQRMAAFNPMNQRMAQMLGPDAAFKPEQLASMVQNPLKPQLPPELMNYTGTDDKKEQQIRDYMYQLEQYKKAEEARKQRVMGGVSPLPAGPAPISMPTPQAARRY
jgi:hypothetical protein